MPYILLLPLAFQIIFIISSSEISIPILPHISLAQLPLSILPLLLEKQVRLIIIVKVIVMGVYIVLLAILALSSATSNQTNKIWPKPESYSFNPHGDKVKITPCEVQFVIQSPTLSEPQQMIEWYLLNVFKCETSACARKATLVITIDNGDIIVPTAVEHERYTISITNRDSWTLNANYYPGFLRGLETFSQLFELNDQEESEIVGLPILISDGPQFRWRGFMIDTSRHYMPVSTVKRALDSMLYSKLNVLHWHIIDEDSFPMVVPTVPELSEFGSVGGIFTPEDIQSVIDYARLRGIRVIPEIDTPAHTRSWGRSEKYKDITLDCNGIYMGQFDPTINTTWEVVEKVMDFVNTTFQDQYIHFGGDEVIQPCWDAKPSIKEWMVANNISDYEALSVNYRQRQKKIWRSISPKKKVIYWANEEIDLPMQDEDVIEWWGVVANVGQIVGRKNEVILVNKDEAYLDYGFNNMYGNVYGVYADWRKMYGFKPRMESVNVIGGETCMWNEASNLHTFDQKVIQRASVIGERLWNDYVDLDTEIRNIATRLTAHAARFRERGFKIWPVTVGLCEKQMDICF